MKTFEELGVKVPEILLPKNVPLEKWSVVACDQYTQNQQYWDSTKKVAGKEPSTLNIIYPEIYLNAPDKKERIAQIHSTMKDYLNNGVFAEPENCFVYVERTTAYGRTRKGLVVAIDLETYEWKPFSKALIRATEATIVERIPPRKEIRNGAAIESPHIMLLVDDPECKLVETIGKKVCSKNPVYSGNLMASSGSIKGWKVSSADELEIVQDALNQLAQKNTMADGSIFLFAVGDGNHSLATAKAVWEEEKLKPQPNQNVRYALVEIVNIYDSGLTFEPIHRVLFNVAGSEVVKFVCKELNGNLLELANGELLAQKVADSKNSFGFTYTVQGEQKFVLVETKVQGLAVAKFQPVLDKLLEKCKQNGTEVQIDFIHGTQDTLDLGSKGVGILLPPIAKDSFFGTISNGGPLPRKSFSMGEADEKRFYLECRKLYW